MKLNQIFQSRSGHHADEILKSLRQGVASRERLASLLEGTTAAIADKVVAKAASGSTADRAQAEIFKTVFTALQYLHTGNNEDSFSAMQSILNHRRSDADSDVFSLSTAAARMIAETKNTRDAFTLQQTEAIVYFAKHCEDYSINAGSGTAGSFNENLAINNYIAASKSYASFGLNGKSTELANAAQLCAQRQGHSLKPELQSYVNNKR